MKIETRYVITSCSNTTYSIQNNLSYWTFSIIIKKTKQQSNFICVEYKWNNSDDIVVLRKVVDSTSIEFHTLKIKLKKLNIKNFKLKSQSSMNSETGFLISLRNNIYIK